MMALQECGVMKQWWKMFAQRTGCGIALSLFQLAVVAVWRLAETAPGSVASYWCYRAPQPSFPGSAVRLLRGDRLATGYRLSIRALRSTPYSNVSWAELCLARCRKLDPFYLHLYLYLHPHLHLHQSSLSSSSAVYFCASLPVDQTLPRRLPNPKGGNGHDTRAQQNAAITTRRNVAGGIECGDHAFAWPLYRCAWSWDQ